MTLDDVKNEAYPGAVIKSDHIDTIVDSISALSLSLKGVAMNVSLSATNAPYIYNIKQVNVLGTFTVTCPQAGTFYINCSENSFNPKNIINVTSKSDNVNFYVTEITLNRIKVLAKDTNGYAVTLNAGEGFFVRIEQ